MPGPTNIGTISTCINQADSFGCLFKPSEGVSMSGAVVTCQIRRSAQRGNPILSPTIETELIDGDLQAIFSWTEAQSSVLRVGSTSFDKYADYVIEIDLALSDAPTEDIMRFCGTLRVYPGGNDPIT